MDIQAILAIALIDLALSGDNALVIGMAARSLHGRQRRLAIGLGTFGAIALRVLAAAVATVLLTIPFLQLVGGLVLAAIAYRLVRPGDSGRHTVGRAATLRQAIVTILIADAAMSTENVLGVAAAAHGDIPLLLFGLALSIPIVLFGSGMLASLLDRVPQIVWLGAAALAWTAVDLILGDPMIPALPAIPGANTVLAMTLLACIFLLHRARQRA